MRNYYEILQINQSATSQEIKTAHRAYALLSHPDKACSNKKLINPYINEINPTTTNIPAFHLIQEAYETLIDPIRRKEYDILLKNLKDQHKFYNASSTTPIIHLSEMTVEKCCIVIENEEDIEEEVYTYECQCGDIFDVFQRDVKHSDTTNIVRECSSCSLCICIHIDIPVI